MKTKNQFCRNCYFFQKTGEKPPPTGDTESEGGEIGFCRQGPPYPFIDGNGRPNVGRFPIVLGGMWCGAFDFQDGPATAGKETTK